MLADL
jgi:hypothetical protein